MPENGDGWAVWGKKVLHEQDRQNNCIEALTKELSELRAEYALQKGKIIALGGAAGLIPAIATLIYHILKGN